MTYQHNVMHIIPVLYNTGMMVFGSLPPSFLDLVGEEECRGAVPKMIKKMSVAVK
jgi:hypothetical protein